MELLVNDILNLSKEEIDNSKVELNMVDGSSGYPIIDKWLKHTNYEKENGTCHDCSYWAGMEKLVIFDLINLY